MSDCEIIKDAIERIEAGENPNNVIPYDVRGMSENCIKELMMIYLKYGGDDGRKEFIEKRLKEL